MNKKYALFAIAAIVAIGGVVYFGTGANQQASVANIAKMTSTSQSYETLVNSYKSSLSSIISKVNAANPGTSERRRVVETGYGECVLMGPAGRIFAVFEC